MANPNNVPYTTFGPDGPPTSMFNSLMQSLYSDGQQPSPTPVSSPASTAASATSTDSVGKSSTDQVPSTLSTVTSGSDSSSATDVGSSSSSSPSSSTSLSSEVSSSGSRSSLSSSNTATATATNAASNSETGALAQEDNCNSVSCSPGLKAAIAVPVVIGVLAIFALIFFLLRRRKRTRGSTPVLQEKPRKKWTRHLRIFSFDTELLMSGRFSSNNSLRSGQSSHRAGRGVHRADNASIHSIEEVAPPYRDAVSHAQNPNMSQSGTPMVAGAVGRRASSRISAPPSYNSSNSRPGSRESDDPATPMAGHRNPFSDSNPVSPVEGSPFNDPLEDGRSLHSGPPVSRNSSIRTGLLPDDTSSIGGTENGSIHEAQVVRHVSVTSGGRTISNVREGSHSPPSSR